VKKSKIVTVLIILSIAVFTILIANNYFKPDINALIQISGIQRQGSDQRQGNQGQQQGNQGDVQQQGGQRQSGQGDTQGGQRQGNQGNNQPQGGRGSSRNASAVRVTEVIPGTIEKSVILNGDVLARNQVSIFPTMAGKLVEVRLNVGDRVRSGEIVATVDPSRPGEIYSRSPVISTVSGTILQAPYVPGDTVTAQSAVYVVGDLSALQIETFVPERFVAAVIQGLSAQVWLEAIPNQEFKAEVTEINPVLDPASRTMRIRMRFVNADSGSGIKAGMFATISLVTNRKINVPVIPRNSVINTYGSWIVFTVDDMNIARRRELKLGIESEELFEVVSGLSLGEKVVSQGQNFLSDGDPVRIVE
jgi:multidrug efflux pump subunit AcrA (membrane-fusion protein)